MIVHLLEGKLPKKTLERWEASLERDEFPSLDSLYEFLYKTAVCVSKRDRSNLLESERGKSEPPAKRKRISPSHRALALNTSRNCKACNAKQHPLYMCDKFKQLPVHKRIDIVRGAKLCYNCMRSHLGSLCKFSTCTICKKRHNTLLHVDKSASTNPSVASRSETTNNE